MYTLVELVEISGLIRFVQRRSKNRFEFAINLDIKNTEKKRGYER